jgi:methyl-accepting chemotaxis protein
LQRANVANDRQRLTGQILIMGGLLSVVLGGVLIFFLVRNIVKPLHYAVKVAEHVASGDLSSEIISSNTDEAGQMLTALHHMNQSLNHIVSQVRYGAHEIALASNQILEGNSDLVARTTEQARHLDQTSAAMKELTQTVGQNTEHARQANQFAESASQVAVKGGGAVSVVIDTMVSINESSKKIGDIIAVIDSISFQTNILALNAAVEAARAGEQGRGFAVVATEVRSLAQRSAAAAKEIKELITESFDRVETGSRMVQEAGKTMEEIVVSVKRVSEIVNRISNASENQSSEIEKINESVENIDQDTKQNVIAFESVTVAADSLLHQARNLEQTLCVFILANELTPISVQTNSIAPSNKS